MEKQWYCDYVQEHTQSLHAEDSEEENKNGKEKYKILP